MRCAAGLCLHGDGMQAACRRGLRCTETAVPLTGPGAWMASYTRVEMLVPGLCTDGGLASWVQAQDCVADLPPPRALRLRESQAPGVRPGRQPRGELPRHQLCRGAIPGDPFLQQGLWTGGEGRGQGGHAHPRCLSRSAQTSSRPFSRAHRPLGAQGPRAQPRPGGCG